MYRQVLFGQFFRGAEWQCPISTGAQEELTGFQFFLILGFYECLVRLEN